MNIFLLDESPIQAARDQHDRHVVKMILETSQMLSTACHVRPALFKVDLPEALYKPTHAAHPCTMWVRESMANFAWATIHLDSLIAEYHRRFGKRHACDTLRWLFLGTVCESLGISRSHVRNEERLSILNPALLDFAANHSEFAIAIPNGMALGAFDIIDGYRLYYMRDKIFQAHVKWTRRTLPTWLADAATNLRYPTTIRTRVAELLRQNAAQVDSYREYGPINRTAPAAASAPIRYQRKLTFNG